jgi:FHA domain
MTFSQARRFMPKLIIHSGGNPAREFELKTGINSVGRGEINGLQILDPSVSTNHAEIVVDGSGVLIKDLNSTNGTFINQARVTEGMLRAGESLRLGNVEMFLQDDLPVAFPASAPVLPDVSAATASPSPRLQARPATPSPPLARAPKGKTACRFHRQSAGEWLCQKCNELFCSACVNIKRTAEGMTVTCRKCGTVCVPVKVNFVAPKEKKTKVYSDGVILVRCLGFGLGAALLSAVIWIGLSKLFGFDVPFLFFPMTGVLCGYAVKYGNQDTPGVLFSSIAVGYFLIGSALGKAGMLAVTHLSMFNSTALLTGVVGLVIGLFAAWKIGGGE